MKASSIGKFFTYAVALLAAVLGDAVVEGISNADILWHGNYTDRSSLDHLPVLLVAITALIMGIGVAFKRAACVQGWSTRSLTLSIAQVLVPPRILRMLPAVVTLQMLALFIMETTEQLVVFGHPLGGTIWLGGPVIASLAIHAFFGVVCVFALSNALRALATGLARVVDCILSCYQKLVRSGATIRLKLGRTSCVFDLVVMGPVVGRGPPLPSLL